MAAFSVKDGKEGVIGKNGKWLIKPQYDSVYYHENVAVWELESGEKTDLYFSGFSEFVKNLDLVESITPETVVGIKGNKQCIIDLSSGKAKWRKFDIVLDDSEGLFPVRNNNQYGFVDNKGEWVYSPQFEDAKPFSEGLAAVKVGGKWGFIANPLVYEEWNESEQNRANLFLSLPENYADSNETPILESEFISLLRSAIGKLGGTEVCIDIPAKDKLLTYPSAIHILSSVADELGMYSPYYLFEDSGRSVNLENSSELAYAVQTGIIDEDAGNLYSTCSQVSWHDAVALSTRFMELSLDYIQ